MRGDTTEALPPFSNAAKLVRVPSPFNKPPNAANATSDGVIRQSSCMVAAMTAAITKNATQNQMNESSNEILLVLSFWVTPVIQKKTSAMVASQIQVCIDSNTQQVNRDQGERESRHLWARDRLL